jgi:hypothetical protein
MKVIKVDDPTGKFSELRAVIIFFKMSGGGGTVRSPPISPSEDMSPFVATGLAFPAAQEARSLLEQMSPKTAVSDCSQLKLASLLCVLTLMGF